MGRFKTLIKPGRLQIHHEVPRSIRNDPFADPPPITDKDLNRGIYNLMLNGIIPRDVDISAAFKRGGDLISSHVINIPLIDLG